MIFSSTTTGTIIAERETYLDEVFLNDNIQIHNKLLLI